MHLPPYEKSFMQKTPLNSFQGKANLTANQGSNKKRLLIIISSVLISLLGIAAIVAGAAIMYLNTQNDSEGYALSETCTVKTSSTAFILWVGSPVSEARLKWVVSSANSKEVFAGWGAASTVNAYTGNYQYATPESGWSYTARAYQAAINISSIHIINTNSPALAPAPESLYSDTVKTAGSSTLYCTPNNSGDKMGMLVIMNSDGSSGIDAQIQLGSKIALYGWLPYVLLPIGIVLLMMGLLLFRKSRK
jgi:hypothetical protein